MAADAPMPNPSPPEAERPVFERRPSARDSLGWILWGLALLPVFLLGVVFLGRAWYRTAATRYRLTTQRLFVETGWVAKQVEEVELFRVKDVTLRQGVLQRLLGVGNVVVLSTDDTAPRLELAGIRRPVEIKEAIRSACQDVRRRQGLRVGEFIAS